jgi:hypothetical protein
MYIISFKCKKRIFPKSSNQHLEDHPTEWSGSQTLGFFSPRSHSRGPATISQDLGERDQYMIASGKLMDIHGDRLWWFNGDFNSDFNGDFNGDLMDINGDFNGDRLWWCLWWFNGC